MKAVFIALVLCAAFAGPVHAKQRLYELKIARGGGGEARFMVERAWTREDREYGLMGRKTVKPDQGMLFQYENPGMHVFWMKDTYAYLDMIFFGIDGSITYIHPNAKPLDMTTIFPPGRQDTCAVLELGGGGAAKAGLKVGDRMIFNGFSSACLPGPAE